MKTRITIILAVGIAVILVVYVAVNGVLRPEDGGRPPFFDGDREPADIVGDYGDARVLVGYSQNIFAGKVLREEGRIPSYDLQIPKIQYDVEVIYNIKGEAPKEVVVNLDAGELGNLDVGTTYLFAARYIEELSPWYHVGLRPMIAAITGDKNLANEQTLNLIFRHQRTYDLLNAYPNEILDGYDVEHGYTQNSFLSLSDEEKEVVYTKFSELIPSRDIPEILPPPHSPPSPTNEGGTDCINGVDGDKDGLVGKDDPDCHTYFREDVWGFCVDGRDNDRDGLTDAHDPDCAEFYPQPKPAPTPTSPPPYVPATSTSATTTTQ